ncbi:MAG: porin [Pseudomonadota bacterium]
MKKAIVSMMVVAANAAFAQSSVTVFGIIDAGVSYGKGSGAGSANKLQVSNSAHQSSRLGFRGVEDLGGGMSASFWLEAGMTNDDGQGGATNANNQATGTGPAVAGRQGLSFNRRSTLSLAGAWGELRLGRDYTPAFLNIPAFEPFTVNGVGTAQNFVGAFASGAPYAATGGTGVVARVSNSVGYLLPANLGGFYGQAMYYMGENASNAPNSKDGTGAGLRVGYASGPVNAAFGTNKTKYIAGNVTSSNLGASYDFDVVKVMAQVSRDEVSGAAADGKGAVVGAVLRLAPGEVRTSWSTYKTTAAGNPKASKFAIGYVHNLSKRTAVYGTAARLRNSGGSAQSLAGSITAPNSSSTGFDIGLRHSF